MVTAYNVISCDGYIARKNGDEDFIPDELWGTFLNLCKKYDTEVMGGNTYRTIQKYPKKQILEFENLSIQKIIVTNDLSFAAKPGYTVVHSPKEAFALGKNVLLSSGPGLNTSALNEGLIDKVILIILSEEIGQGIKQFNIEPNLTLRSEKIINGKRWCEYEVIK